MSKEHERFVAWRPNAAAATDYFQNTSSVEQHLNPVSNMRLFFLFLYCPCLPIYFPFSHYVQLHTCWRPNSLSAVSLRSPLWLFESIVWIPKPHWIYSNSHATDRFIWGLLPHGFWLFSSPACGCGLGSLVLWEGKGHVQYYTRETEDCHWLWYILAQIHRYISLTLASLIWTCNTYPIIKTVPWPLTKLIAPMHLEFSS